MIPHATNLIIELIQKAAAKKNSKGQAYDFLLIEIGGTVGDFQSNIFYESVRQLTMKRG